MILIKFVLSRVKMMNMVLRIIKKNKSCNNAELRSKLDFDLKSRLGFPAQQQESVYALNATRYNKSAFTLSEVLMTMIVIGVIFTLTIPTLVDNFREREILSGFSEFNSILDKAVQSWKQSSILCSYTDAYTCLALQNLSPNNCSNFDQISKYIQVGEKLCYQVDSGNAFWLAEKTY